MVLIFTQTTTCLASEFVNSFSAESLAMYLFRVAKETGVEFNRQNRTFTIVGQWSSINAAHKSLEKIFIEKNQNRDDSKSEQSNEIPDKLDRLVGNFCESDGYKRGRKPGYTVQPSEYSVPDPLVYIKFLPQEGGTPQKPIKLIQNDTKIIISGDVGTVGVVSELQNEQKITTSKQSGIHSKQNNTSFEQNDVSSNETDQHQSVSDMVTVEEPCDISCNYGTTVNSVEITEAQPAQDMKVDAVDTVCIKQEHEEDIIGTEDNMDDDTDIDEQSILHGAPSSIEKGPWNDSLSTISGIAETKHCETSNHTAKEELQECRTRRASRGKKERTVKSMDYKCDLCPYVSSKRSNLKTHRRIHRKKFSCELCDKKFARKTELARHINVHENGIKRKRRQVRPQQTKLKPTEKKEMEEEKTEYYKCEICTYIGFKKENLKDHMKRKHRNDFTCDVCGKKFGLNKDLGRHKKQVHCEAKHYCEKCNRVYKSKRRLDHHLKTHEADYVKPSFDCEICEKSFTTKYVLAAHIKSEHLGMKRIYQCPLCGRSFTQRNSYLMHANVHAGIKPYVCDKCGKSFTYEKSWKEHKYMHDQIRRFKCQVCEKTFRQSTSLRIHMKIHQEIKDYICKYCGKGFSQKNALIRHERIHSGVKPFACSLCKKTYNDISITRRHLILIHKVDSKKWREAVISNTKKDEEYFIPLGDQADEPEMNPLEEETLPPVEEVGVTSAQNTEVSESVERDGSSSNVAIQSIAYECPSTDLIPVNYSEPSTGSKQLPLHVTQSSTKHSMITIQPLSANQTIQTTECNPSASHHFSGMTARNSGGTPLNIASNDAVRWSYAGFPEYSSWTHYNSSH